MSYHFTENDRLNIALEKMVHSDREEIVDLVSQIRRITSTHMPLPTAFATLVIAELAMRKIQGPASQRLARLHDLATDTAERIVFGEATATTRPARMSGAERLARAVLLYHRDGIWTDEKRKLWVGYTGDASVTTKTLISLSEAILADEIAA